MEGRESRRRREVSWHSLVVDPWEQIPRAEQSKVLQQRDQDGPLFSLPVCRLHHLIGERREIAERTDTMKVTMASLEERNKESKDEKLLFGSETSAGDIRMLGVWIRPEADISNRKKRAGLL